MKSRKDYVNQFKELLLWRSRGSWGKLSIVWQVSRNFDENRVVV